MESKKINTKQNKKDRENFKNEINNFENNSWLPGKILLP